MGTAAINNLVRNEDGRLEHGKLTRIQRFSTWTLKTHRLNVNVDARSNHFHEILFIQCHCSFCVNRGKWS